MHSLRKLECLVPPSRKPQVETASKVSEAESSNKTEKTVDHKRVRTEKVLDSPLAKLRKK